MPIIGARKRRVRVGYWGGWIMGGGGREAMGPLGPAGGSRRAGRGTVGGEVKDNSYEF